MKFIKISTRDSGNSIPVNPEKFNSEHLLAPQRVNNIHIIVKNMYYAGYKDQSAIIDQLEKRNIDIIPEIKKAVNDAICQIEDSQEKPAPSFEV